MTIHSFCFLIILACFNALGPVFSLVLAICMREERCTILNVIAIIIAVGAGVLIINLDLVIRDIASEESFNPRDLFGYMFSLLNILSNAFGRPAQRVSFLFIICFISYYTFLQSFRFHILLHRINSFIFFNSFFPFICSFLLFLSPFQDTSKETPIIAANFYMNFFSTIVTAFVAIPFWRQFHPSALHAISWISLSYSIVFGSALCFVLMSVTALYISPTVLSIYALLIPAFTILISAVVLKERVGWRTLAGLALSALALGVIVLQRQIDAHRKKTRKQEESENDNENKEEEEEKEKEGKERKSVEMEAMSVTDGEGVQNGVTNNNKNELNSEPLIESNKNSEENKLSSEYPSTDNDETTGKISLQIDSPLTEDKKSELDSNNNNSENSDNDNKESTENTDTLQQTTSEDPISKKDIDNNNNEGVTAADFLPEE